MATWPANGDTDWNTAMLAYLAVEHNTDGTHKVYSAYTTLDSENNTMVKAHAYLAATNGWVFAYDTDTDTGESLYVYVGTTTDPAGAGDLIQASEAAGINMTQSVCAAVAKGEYFEVRTDSGGTPVIRWKSAGTLSKPVDQD